MLLKNNDTIIRVLKSEEDKSLVIDCIKRTMPKWVMTSSLSDFEEFRIYDGFLLELALMDCKLRKQVGNFLYIATNPRPQGRGFLVFTEAAPAVLHSPVLFVLSERKSAEAAVECLLRG